MTINVESALCFSNVAELLQSRARNAASTHSLEDDLKGHWSIWVNGNWRLTFTFEGTDAILVDYQDYH